MKTIHVKKHYISETVEIWVVTMNKESVIIWDEMVMAYFKVINQPLAGQT